MAKQGAGKALPRALKRFIKRALLAAGESSLFKVSRSEAEALAKRAWFKKHNRDLIVKASLRVRLVRDLVYVQEELSWANVLDGMSPTDPPKLGRCKEVDAVLAPQGRDYRYVHAADFKGHKFTDESVRKLHLIVLETAVEAVVVGAGAKERQEALRWIFRPPVVLHPTPGKPPVKTSRIPFNFRLCCQMAVADPDAVQDRILSQMDANERKAYEVFKVSGDGEISRRSLRAQRRSCPKDKNLGWRRVASSRT